MQHLDELDELDEATIDEINRGLLRRYWTETPKHLRPPESCGLARLRNPAPDEASARTANGNPC